MGFFQRWFTQPGTVEELGLRGDVAELIECLDHWNTNVRVRAAQLLGQLGDDSAVEALLAILDREDPSWNTDFVEVVRTVGGLDPTLRPQAMSLAFRFWYRMRAHRWWNENQDAKAICDDGNERLRQGEGYLRPGNYLVCRNCADRFLGSVDWCSVFLKMNRVLGPKVPEDLLSLGREWSNQN